MIRRVASYKHLINKLNKGNLKKKCQNMNPWQDLETFLIRISVNSRLNIEDPFAAILSRGRIQ
jgi:hypothetical protein